MSVDFNVVVGLDNVSPPDPKEYDFCADAHPALSIALTLSV